MFLQAGGGGKGIRPIQQAQQQSQQTTQQQSQQHQNQIPTHHQTQSVIASSSTHSLQTHHQPSQTNNQQLHLGHPQQQQTQLQQQQQQQQQQQSATHLNNIQPPLLAQPHHQQTTLQHPPHHHPAIPYYTYQLSQAPQPPSHQQQHQHQQQQVPNNGSAAAPPLVISTSNQTSSGNGSSSTTNNVNNNSSNNSGLLRQHSTTGNGNMPTIYAPNTALLQSPTATPGFMTPYMQQYPLQTAVIAAAAAAAQYPNNQPPNGNNNNNGGGHNSQNNGGPPQSIYQITQQPHQQQPIMQYFHPAAGGVATAPTPTAPPHLHPSQPQFRGVLTSSHTQRHNSPATYLLPAAPTTLYAMSSGQLTTGPSQRASLLPAPGQQTTGANGNIPMSQLMQAATTPTGAATFMPAAFCTAPMGMTPGALAGTSPLMTAGAPLGPSPLQTYGHLANVSMSSSNTSMSSLGEGNTKPRPHAIPIIHPITHENILDPKPLQKSASVETKPNAAESNENTSSSTSCVTTNNIETDDKTSSTSVSSKWRDKSITVSIPMCKPLTSSNSSTSRDKMDQQMQTDVVREKLGNIKIDDTKKEKPNVEKINVSKPAEITDLIQQGDAANRQTELKAHFPKETTVGDNDDNCSKDISEDEQLIVVLDEKKTYVFTSSQKSDEDGSIKTLEGENENVQTSPSEDHGDFESKKYNRENLESSGKFGSHESIETARINASKPQKIIHDKGQQAFIPKNSEQHIQYIKREQNSDAMCVKTPSSMGQNIQLSTAPISVKQASSSETPKYKMNTLATVMTSTAVSQTAYGPSTTTLVPSNSSTPTKGNNGRRHRGNKQSKFKNRQEKQGGVEYSFINFTDASSSTATSNSSCSSISSNSGVQHDISLTGPSKSSTTLIANVQDSTTTPGSFAKPSNNVAAIAISSSWTLKPVQHQQQQQSYKRQQQHQQTLTQQQQHFHQPSTKNTPTTSGASSSTASTPTHQLHQASTDTSTTPTPGNKRKSRNKRTKEQKKKNEPLTNRNQSQQQLPQKQQSLSSLRGNSNTNFHNNTINVGSSSNSNLNYHNSKNNKKATNSYQMNLNNNTMAVTTTAYTPANAANNQTDNNNENNYNTTSCTNVSSNHSFRKNSLTSSFKPTQPLQQQQQQQQQQPQPQPQQQPQYQSRYHSNNSSSNQSSRCSITFGGLSSDAGSISEAESKVSITGFSSEMGLPGLRCNFSSENTTPSSSLLTSPKKSHRHIRAREIVAQYLTTTNTTDSGSDKTNGSDEPSLQFLNSSSSACEDDDESNARLQFRKQQLKLEKQQLDHYQQPLEFGIGAMALSDIDEVYFGDFSAENDFGKSTTKTDDDVELDVTITKIFESQKSKQPIADTVDCVPIHATTISQTSNESGNTTSTGGKKITILKSTDKDDPSTRQRDFAAAMKPAPGSIANATRPKIFRYSLRDLRDLANSPESCKPPMVRCQKGDCVSQLFVSRQQHHLSSHQTHATLSALALQQHLQQYQQINYNESIEFVTGKRRGGGGSGVSGADRLKKHDHLSSMTMGGIGNNIGMMGLMSGGVGSSNSGQQQRKMDIIRVHLSLKEEIKLSECENAWTPDTLRVKSAHRSSSSTSPNDDLEAVLKKVRGVLNKLTPNNFDVLLKTMTSISMNTQEKMQQVMLLIFEKTVSEPNFAPTYAKFCKVLFQEIKAESKSLFSTLLITRIQHEFETNVNDADAKQKKLQPLVDKLAACTDQKERVDLQAELEDQEYQFRRRAWGTVRFIGEMYKLQSLTSDRVLMCIESLLEHGSEEKLEFMCKLLTTVGYLLEAATPEQLQVKTRIDNIFRRMQEIVQRSRGTGGQRSQAQAKISSRVRFMMQDVMDLRARHWDQQPRVINAGGSTQSAPLQQQQQQLHQPRRKDDKSHGTNASGLGSNIHEKQQNRGYGSAGNNSQTHRQLRGGSNISQSDNNHYFMQKSNKQYTQQHHQQQDQKVNIDVNKLRFTRGDEVTPSTTKLGSSSLYLWRTAGRPSTSNSSLTTSTSATSASSSQQLALSTQASSTGSVTSVGNSNNFRRQTSNPFEVLDRVSPTTQPASSDGDDAFTDETDDQANSEANYSYKECQQLINRLVEEVFDVTAAETSWQKETLAVWCNASLKQQVALLHYLLMDYLHLGSVKRQQREACAKIFKHIVVTPEVFDKAVFDEAYAQFAEEFPDLLVDVPDGWVYVFEFIGPLLHSDLLSFDDIWQPQWSDDKYFTERFLKAFINYFTHEHGANYMRDMWYRRYGLEHGQKFMVDPGNWKRFISNNRYDYLLDTTMPAETKRDHGRETECPTSRVTVGKHSAVDANDDEHNPTRHIERIGELLHMKNGTDLAMEYIISNVPINSDFLRGLTELFCCDIATTLTADTITSTSATSNNPATSSADKKERLKGKCLQQQPRRFELEIFRKKCLPVLRLCVDSNESLELSCLDAIYEILLDNYEEPKANKMICSVFDLFYDTELIPKDTFEKWYQTQSLVDDAIEAAGATNINETITSENNSKTTTKKQNLPKKQHNQHHKLHSSAQSNPIEVPDNNNNPHKISVELHAYMRQLLSKMWCKTSPTKQLVQ